MDIKSTFAERLMQLMEESGETVEQLSNAISNDFNISVSVGSLIDYRKGRARANIEALYGIAKHYDVSTDWLLGLSHVRAPSAELQQVCKFTGLSQMAVTNLHYYAENSTYKLPIRLIDEIMSVQVLFFESYTFRATKAYIQLQRNGSARKRNSTGKGVATDWPKEQVDMMYTTLSNSRDEREQVIEQIVMQPKGFELNEKIEVPTREAYNLYYKHAVRAIERAAEDTIRSFHRVIKETIQSAEKEDTP